MVSYGHSLLLRVQSSHPQLVRLCPQLRHGLRDVRVVLLPCHGEHDLVPLGTARHVPRLWHYRMELDQHVQLQSPLVTIHRWKQQPGLFQEDACAHAHYFLVFRHHRL